MPGKPNSSRSSMTSGVMKPRSSAMMGSSPRDALMAWNSSRPGACDPAAALGRRVAARYLPVGREAAEVVDADDVHERERRAHALDPPAEAVRAHPLPVVKRVAPELPRLAEVVGRDSGDDRGRAVLLELEQVGVAPTRRPSRARRRWGCRRRCCTCWPRQYSRSRAHWSKKRNCLNFTSSICSREPRARASSAAGSRRTSRLLPLRPRRLAALALERAVERVVVEPRRGRGLELLEGGGATGGLGASEVLEGLVEQRAP